YVMPKHGKTNWKEDDSWTNIILDDVYDTFYRDEEQETDVAKENDNEWGKEAEHDHLKVNKGKLEVNLAKAIKARQVDDHDDDLGTFDLENRIKKLEEYFGRLLKAKMAKESMLAELKAKKAKEENEAMLAEVVHISNDEDDDEDHIASTSIRSKAPIASTSNAQAASTAPKGYEKLSMTGYVLDVFAPNAPPPLATRKRKST
nr:hypothetical protein [Tanacetum cinerariifolium]